MCPRPALGLANRPPNDADTKLCSSKTDGLLIRMRRPFGNLDYLLWQVKQSAEPVLSFLSSEGLTTAL